MTQVLRLSLALLLWGWHMGERRRRLTLPKQRRVGVASQPMKPKLKSGEHANPTA
jgi:hypothetical protein